jgi:hypothetical protein
MNYFKNSYRKKMPNKINHGIKGISYQISHQVSLLEEQVCEMQKQLSEKDEKIRTLMIDLENAKTRLIVYEAVITHALKIDVEQLYEKEERNDEKGEEKKERNDEKKEGKQSPVKVKASPKHKDIKPVSKGKVCFTEEKETKEEKDENEEEKEEKEDTGSKTEDEDTKKHKKGPGKKFTKLKNVVEPDDISALENFKKIGEDKLEKLKKKHGFHEAQKSILEKVNAMLNNMSEISKADQKVLKQLSDTRIKLIGIMTLPEYIKLVLTHIKKLESIFSSKKINKAKIVSHVQKSLSPLEQRLTSYKNYHDSHLQPEECQLYKAVLRLNMNYNKEYKSFSYDELCLSINNYGIALFSLKNVLKIALVNPYKFYNIIYINKEGKDKEGKEKEGGKEKDKEKTSDPYTFYTLESISSKGRRQWRMECRLDDLSKKLSMSLMTYCVSLFRKIYYDAFNDNVYRPDYKEKAPIFSEDCEQLLTNILLIARQKQFCNLMRFVISKFCVITPTTNDSFNFTADDGICKKNFDKRIDSIEDVEGCIKRLFDNISEDDIKKLSENVDIEESMEDYKEGEMSE